VRRGQVVAIVGARVSIGTTCGVRQLEASVSTEQATPLLGAPSIARPATIRLRPESLHVTKQRVLEALSLLEARGHRRLKVFLAESFLDVLVDGEGASVVGFRLLQARGADEEGAECLKPVGLAESRFDVLEEVRMKRSPSARSLLARVIRKSGR